QEVVVSPAQVEMRVDDDADKALPDAPAHDTRLRVVDSETLVARDTRDKLLKTNSAARERAIAKKREIVDIARVTRARRARGCGETSVETERAEVRDHRQCGHPRGQMHRAIQPPRQPAPMRVRERAGYRCGVPD